MPSEMQFFTPRAASGLGTVKGSADWKRREQAYAAHLNAIRESLPSGWIKLSAFSFHDCEIIGIEQTKKTLRIKLDGRAAWSDPPAEFYTLDFVDVREAWINEHYIGMRWIYQEVHCPSVECGELRATFDKGKLRVVSGDVKISMKEFKIQKTKKRHG